MPIKLIHHGAHEGVTGSCHQLWTDDNHSLLVDCGTFQGDDAKRNSNPEIRFPLAGVESLLLTHVHIDHVGRIPYLLAADWEGPIFCSQPTAKLLPLVMEDALRIGFTRNRRMIEAFLKKIDRLLRPVSYHRWVDLPAGARARFRPAGHVLGSAIIEVELPKGEVVVFSGDLGPEGEPMLKPFTSPPRADLLVLESTYGDRLHPNREDRQAELEQVLRHTLDNLGVTIIPAFSLGRTQSLLFEMNGIFERVQQVEKRSLMKQVDVVVDSPLATRFTDLFEQLRGYWGEEAQRVLTIDDQPLVFENLTTVRNYEEHSRLIAHIQRHELPAIVVAGSGMCTGGRIVNYLKRFVGQPETDIVFVGYQAAGTPGSYLQRGSDWVRLDGKKFDVRARVHTLAGYSAHADQAGLVDFVAGFESPPTSIRLVHGEYHAKKVLAEKLRQRGYQVE
jgi:metallo-beta-lactamase family protein